MDQSAEQIAAPDTIKIDHVGHFPLARRLRAQRRLLPERPVRPVLVAVPDIRRIALDLR